MNFDNIFVFRKLLQYDVSLKTLHCSIGPSSALIVHRPVNILPSTMTIDVSNNFGKNPLFCFFALFLVASITPFIDKPLSINRYLKLLVISFPIQWIAASVADIPPTNANGSKTFLAKVVSRFFIIGNSTVINDLRELRNPPS